MPTTSAALDARVDAVARRQLRLVTARQLRAAGVDGRGLAGRIERRMLTRVVRGVYVAGPPLLSDDMLALAGTFLAGPGAVVGGASAAAMRGLLPRRAGVTTVLRPGRASDLAIATAIPMADGGRGVIHVRQGRHRDDEVDPVGPCAVSAVPRLLADLAARSDDSAFFEAWRQAEFRRMLDVAALERQLAGGRRPGHARLRAQLAAFRPLAFEGGAVESLLELDVLRLVLAAGAPVPLVNHWIDTPGGVRERRRLDVLWLLEGLALEADGWGAHGTRSAFEDDRIRDAELLALGIVTTRYTWQRLNAAPAACAAQILGVLAQRGARIESRPPGVETTSVRRR